MITYLEVCNEAATSMSKTKYENLKTKALTNGFKVLLSLSYNKKIIKLKSKHEIIRSGKKTLLLWLLNT